MPTLGINGINGTSLGGMRKMQEDVTNYAHAVFTSFNS